MSADTIPDDVRVAAKVALFRARVVSVLDDQIDIIARALVAERERCAQMAENFGWCLPMYESAEMNEATDHAACEVQEQIAAAIRNHNR